MTIDFERVKSTHPLSDIVGRYVSWDKSKSRPGDMWACCPFHAEKTASFHVRDAEAKYKCFGCGATGDMFDFLDLVEGRSPSQVLEMLDAGYVPARIEQKSIPKPEQTYVISQPGDERIEAGQKLKLWNPKRQRWTYVQPSMVFAYRNSDKELIGYVIRIETERGKITPQVSWIIKNDGEMCWAFAAFARPRPMYGLDRLAADGPVWIAEGEKACDALNRMTGWSVLAWPGGTEATKYVDWSPLNGRDVIMWADNDEAGIKCAAEIGQRIKAKSFRIVGGINATRAHGWDAADAESEGWTTAQIDEMARSDLPDSTGREGEEGGEGRDGRERREEQEGPRRAQSSMPFRVLGHNKGVYYYMPDGSQQIVALKANEHTPLRLLQMAPMSFWSLMNGQAEDGKVSEGGWLTLAESLFGRAHAAGLFEETRVRGRGAWVDSGRTVIHTGTEATINGEPKALKDIKSHYVYEAQPAWQFGFGDPASSSQAIKLARIAESLTWANEMSGALLTGWCVIAPVSGALPWRPHIWITGPAGSGKTTALNDIVGRIVGPAAERVDGKTTEAAIRQKMGNDARPVIIDEAESEDQASVQRMQGLLDLARVSSSGGVISKGSSNHRAINFPVRSCFCFSSINTSIRHHADESRVSRLVLLPNKSEDRDVHYSNLMKEINETFTQEFASSLFQRTVRYLDVLIENIQTFTSAASIYFKNRRAADQIGPMLAGYYFCYSATRVTLEKATSLIADKKNWSEFLAIENETDEERLFQFLMSRKIRVHLTVGTTEATIGEALTEARKEANGDQPLRLPYTAALGSYGIRYIISDDGECIAVSDNSPNLQSLFRDQPQWQADWKRPMRNMPGAVKSPSSIRFGAGDYARATLLPYDMLDGVNWK